MLLQEIKILCYNYSLRKINIIDDELSEDTYRIKAISICLEKNNLTHVKIGLYIEALSLTEEHCNFFIENNDYIYKIVVLSDLITTEQILLFRKMERHSIKIKVVFKLFNSQTTITYIKFIFR